MDNKLLDIILAIANPLRAYHKHVTHGMANIPEVGPCILVVNHSLATYDIALLMADIYQVTGRLPRSLMDRWFFRFQPIAQFFGSLGSVEGSPDAAAQLLADGEIICVAPGGMKESILPSKDRYQIRWDTRRGFTKLAIKAQVPIVLAACPKADDIYHIMPSQLTDLAYKKLRLPFVLARGIGLTPLPRPVQLSHFLSEPIYPPKMAEEEDKRKRQHYRFHRNVVKRMQELIGEAVTYRESSDIARIHSRNADD